MKKTILFCLLMGAGAALFAQTAAGTLTDPIPVSYSGGAKTLDQIYDEIAAAGKYVDLDLSALTGVKSSAGAANTWPKYSAGHDAGKALIVSLKLPTHVTAIEAGTVGAFYWFTNLKSVSATTSFTGAIGNNAFADNGSLHGCISLTSVSFPAATSIGYDAFFRCTSLTTVSFPKVISIDVEAFMYCSSLTTVSIPATVKLISDDERQIGHQFSATPFTDYYDGPISPISITLKAGIRDSDFLQYSELSPKLWACYTKAGKAAGTYTRTGNGQTGTWAKE